MARAIAATRGMAGDPRRESRTKYVWPWLGFAALIGAMHLFCTGAGLDAASSRAEALYLELYPWPWVEAIRSAPLRHPQAPPTRIVSPVPQPGFFLCS